MSRLPALLLGLIVLPQSRALRRDVPRLPPAAPRAGGSRARGARRLVVLGDSTAVGTGVDDMADAVAGQVARRLPGPVAWRVLGANGLTAAEVRRDVLPEARTGEADAVVLLVGWNDALRLRSARAFGRDLGALLDGLRTAHPTARRVVVAPPRFDRFAVLPQPLRTALGTHAAALGRTAARVATANGAAVVEGFDGQHVAADRFHPDAVGYAELADRIAAALR